MHPHTYSIYPYNKHTHSTYIVAQPEVGAVVVLHRLVWFLVFVQPFFPICALFILVHIFTEAEQYLPMWRFYQVQARKFKWNPLHHWSFFSANIMQLIFCSCTFFLICFTLNWGGPVLHCRAQTLQLYVFLFGESLYCSNCCNKGPRVSPQIP